MSKGPDVPSESTDDRDDHPTELHFEEIESVEIETGEIMDAHEETQEALENESPQPEPTETIHESGYAEPASSAPQEARRAKAKHRWMMRAFFAGILVVIYLLLYWQHSTR